MKFNLKTVRSLFKNGVKIGDGYPQPAASITLHALNETGTRALMYSSVGTIDRDLYLDLAPRELKRIIIKMRDNASAINHDRSQWQLEVHTCGYHYSTKILVD